jgi:hypothetical protein
MISSIDRLQTLDSAAQVLRLQPSTLRRWMTAGRIRCHELCLPESVGGNPLPVAYFRPREILADLSR